jgi:class 3 adenylate cyclase/tetratricopeptide (TPR) repeat protein
LPRTGWLGHDLGIAPGDSSTLDLERRITSAAPAPLREKLRAAPVTGERKPVTALFADVVGSTALAETMDPEEWIGVVTQAFEVMADAAYRYEGTVAQLLGDGLLAFFGAPVAHEDDPGRAVRAALDMVREIDALGEELGLELRIRVGINTGLVVVGNVGNDLRYEYTAIGDAVNVASRVQASATPGTVVITAETFRLVASQLEVVDLGELELKGKSEPVRAYEVVGLSAAPRPARGIPGLDSPTIGRDEELARLRQALDAVRAGRGRAAVVVGEPGIGKTRLVRELREATNGGAPAWIEGQCVSYGERIPYGLVIDLVRSFVGAPPPLSDDHVVEALERRAGELLGDEAADAVRYVRHVLGLPLAPPDAQAFSRLEPERLHSGFVDALRRLLAAAARSAPLAVLCEDLHWADASSVETLRTLMPLAAEAPILLLATTRPDRETPGWTLVVEARDAFGDALTELTLSPLSGEESRTLVAHLLRIEALPDDLRRLILSKGEGNPFFIEEVIRMLVERGALERRGADWVAVAPVEQVDIPTTLHGLLLARVDRLPDAAKRALRVASVIGRRFSPDLLEEVLRGEGVGDELAALEAAGLVRIAVTTPALEYEFRHALVHEAAYDSLLKQERRRLHRAVGETLERAGDVDAAILALHFEHAGDEDRATRYLVAAGKHARERFAATEAYGFFTRAASHLERIDVTESEGRRLHVDAVLGRVRAGYAFMPFDEKLTLLERVLPDAEALGDPRLEAEIHLEMARNLAATREIGEAYERALQRIRDLGEELDDDFLRAQPHIIAGVGAVVTGRYRDAISILGEAVPLLERSGDYAMASFYAGFTALSYARLGEFVGAQEWIERVRRLAETSGDPNAGLDADVYEGNVRGERGDLLEGIRLARRGAERANQVGNMMCEIAGSLAVGDQHFRRGEPAEARPPLERGDELARVCGEPLFETLSHARLSVVRSFLGEAEEGIAGLDEALMQARALGDPYSEGEIVHRRALARTLAAEPDWDAVWADFEASIEIFERLETKPALARALRDYASVLQRAGREAEAGGKLSRAMALSAELQLVAV